MALRSLSINNKEVKSVEFMPLILRRDVADADVEGPGTAEDAEVAEAVGAAGAAEEEETATTRTSLMESM
jgi:hypothetical protein